MLSEKSGIFFMEPIYCPSRQVNLIETRVRKYKVNQLFAFALNKKVIGFECEWVCTTVEEQVFNR